MKFTVYTFFILASILLTANCCAELKDIISQCADCHGKDGLSIENDIPILAGQSEILIEDALLAFAENERPCKDSDFRHGDTSRAQTNMCEIAKKLSDEQKTALSEHYSGIKFIGVIQEFDSSLVERGTIIHERNCEKCHSEGGSLAEDDAGILKGQWKSYLAGQLMDFHNKDRKAPKKMAKKMKKMLNKEGSAGAEALVEFYSK